MELPRPPEDNDLKNIIDKLANFVARNGPEFEQMTKQKQKENLKFSFLFGGEHFNYYQYRVTTEQAIMNQQKQKMAQQAQQEQILQEALARHTIQPGTGPRAWQATNQQLQLTHQLQEQLESLRSTTQEQVQQSETNLSAQYQSLMQQRQIQIEEGIAMTQEEEIQNLSLECEIQLQEFDKVLQPIIDSCTKDAISNGKNWIFVHNMGPKHAKVLALYIKKKITAAEATFEQRLYLIYLINDLLHHCIRKGAEDLKKALESVVIPVFCMAHSGADEDKQHKLVKLLNLWEQNKYFDVTVIQDLKEPGPRALANYQTRLTGDYPNVVSQITQAVNVRYSSLQGQHQEFVNHLNLQVTQLDQQLQQHLQSQQGPRPPTEAVPIQVAVSMTGPPPTSAPPPTQPVGMVGSVPLTVPPPGFPVTDFSKPPPGFGPQPPPPTSTPAPTQFEYGHGQGPPIVQEYNHGQARSASPMAMPAAETSATGAQMPLPDFSRPPPGFPQLPGGGGNGGGPPHPPIPPQMPPRHPQVCEADLMPSVPYFELPAGLMAPLVKLEDSLYRSLESKDIRLPPPMPPNERLLAAVEAFYSPPSREIPRDSEGWEKLGLFEFFKAKEKAKKLKEQERKGSTGSDSGSSSSSRSSSPSGSRSSSRSPSRSPVRRGRSHSPSKSPPYRRRTTRSKSRSKSRSPSPRRRSQERSPSPPHFSEPFYATNTNTRLGQENKGHMLLKKMGWGGGGLGSTEQGIVNPVDHAEVRDRVDMFKGIGMSNNDPFEQFRKNKSQGFIQRMKERDPSAKP